VLVEKLETLQRKRKQYKEDDGEFKGILNILILFFFVEIEF